MPYFVAIDAGGTRTQCLLADEHHVLARASTGSVKLQRVGESEATARLAYMLDELSTAAAVPLTQITRTCIGLAGLSIPAVRAWAAEVLSTAVWGELLLLGDEVIALDAAFPGAPGILLIAGTGSHAIARAPDGTLYRAGGWGPILGDEGGGYWIGLQALRAALYALDTGEEAATQLLTAIQHHFNLSTLHELVEFGNRRTQPAPDFASLAPVVARAAAAGNLTASAILRQAGGELATLITHVATKLGASTTFESAPPASPPPGPEIPIAFTGSILTEIPTVHDSLSRFLARILPAAQLAQHPVDPLNGALYRARRPA
jgi:glucosamine kinase